MNPLAYRTAMQEATAPKFRGKEAIKSKVIPRYPESAEREYQRLMREYSVVYDQVLRAHMPELKRSLGFYGSNFDDVPRVPDEIFNEIERQVAEKLLSFSIRKKLEKIAHMSRKLTVAEWKRVCQRTLGINIFEDYYNGDFFKDAMDGWVQRNVDLIETLSGENLSEMRRIVQEGFAQGRRPEAVAKDINEAYKKTGEHAKMIARDQTAKLNADVTKKQHEDAGVVEYIWDSSRDQRVRACHRALHGKKFRYDDPPEMWYETKSRGRVYTGQRCNPGEWYQCRCVAIPVFNIEGVGEIPVGAVDWDEVDKRLKDVMKK